MFACLYQPPHASGSGTGGPIHRAPGDDLAAIAQAFSPRFEQHRDDLVVIDVAGLERMFHRRPVPATGEREPSGPSAGRGLLRVWRTIGEELHRAAAARGIVAHVAIAGTQTAAALLAQTRPGLTVIARGAEAEMLAPVAVAVLRKLEAEDAEPGFQALARWGIRTLGELAALPAADLVSRLGRQALAWQAAARGEDRRPLIPSLEAERFAATLELEWPIEGLEPLSFVLTRLLEPLSTRLERRDRGAAVFHVLLRLVSREVHARRLELPAPMRDVRALRTLALLDLEAHPPGAAIDRVDLVIDPTPGRILQHALFARAVPAPERISTLVARLGALMGQDRIGAPATLDTYRPGAFAMRPFAVDHEAGRHERDLRRPGHGVRAQDGADGLSALRRCRQPVPARVVVDAEGRPTRVTTDRRGFAGGAVLRCAGPWRSSGDWWAGGKSFDHDEWDVALGDGAVYRVFRDRDAGGWFIEAIVD